MSYMNRIHAHSSLIAVLIGFMFNHKMCNDYFLYEQIVYNKWKMWWHGPALYAICFELISFDISISVCRKPQLSFTPSFHL